MYLRPYLRTVSNTADDTDLFFLPSKFCGCDCGGSLSVEVGLSVRVQIAAEIRSKFETQGYLAYYSYEGIYIPICSHMRSPRDPD